MRTQAPPEINISNTNASSQIVLNDLRLLELLCKYPLLISRQVVNDTDYDDWGWEQVTEAFNESYEDMPPSSPFTTEELQGRWNILRPLISSLAQGKEQIPEPLWKVVVNVNNRLNAEKANSSCQDLVLSQLPLVEALSHSQRLQLEAEFMDLILGEERRTKALHGDDGMTDQQMETVQSDFDEFFAAIKVKELPSDILQKVAMPKPDSKPEIKGEPVQEPEADHPPRPFSSVEESSASSNVTIEPQIKAEPVDEPEAFQPPSPIEEVPSPAKGGAQSPQKGPTTASQNVWIPLENAKDYIKPLRIRVKREDLQDHMPQPTIRRSSRILEKNKNK